MTAWIWIICCFFFLPFLVWAVASCHSRIECDDNYVLLMMNVINVGLIFQESNENRISINIRPKTIEMYIMIKIIDGNIVMIVWNKDALAKSVILK